MLSDIFEENNKNYSFFENYQSIFYFNRDNQGYSHNNLNDDLYNFDDCSILRDKESQKIYDFWNEGKNDDILEQIQEKTTAYKTSNKNNNKCYYAPLKILENIKIDEDNSPKLYSFNDIEEKIFKNDDYKKRFTFDADSMLIKDEKFESQFLNKKRFRDDNEDNFYNEFMENEKVENNGQVNRKKRGRKSENKNVYKEHNKMTGDNIIKKIKAEFFKYMILFINNIIATINLIYNNKIYKIDYDFINRLNREIDLKYLNMTIKDLLSLNVSPKYKKLIPESNKNYIEIMLNGKSLDNATKFVFNMTFRDFIDIFSYKKKVKELLNEYEINDLNNEICDKIEKSLVGVDALLNERAKKDDRKYFSRLVFYLYNYEKWFFMKRGRKKMNIRIDI